MYRLDELGWVDFELLVQTLLISRLGFGVESWGGTGDWGRDAYYNGQLKYPLKELSDGPFLFQCKFVAMANASGAKPAPILLKAVEMECKRIAQRTTGTKKKWSVSPAHYSLISNALIQPTTRERIEHLLHEVLPSSKPHIHDGRDVCKWITLTPGIIPRFPQLFTIRDLNEFLRGIINADILSRSDVALGMAREDAKVFVPTNAYYEAQARLLKHAFVVLEGPPEMGKTTIARILALAMLAQSWEAIECKHPEEFHRAFKAGSSQVFIADDFFGRTEYDPARVSQWQEELPYILRKLDKQHWLILTSRAHLLQMAKHELDISGENSRFPELGEVIVDAGKLLPLEKARILYRHAKAAKFSDSLKSELKLNLKRIVEHEHFTPLRIKNLISALVSGGSKHVHPGK